MQSTALHSSLKWGHSSEVWWGMDPSQWEGHPWKSLDAKLRQILILFWKVLPSVVGISTRDSRMYHVLCPPRLVALGIVLYCTVTCSQFSYRKCTVDIRCRWHYLQVALSTGNAATLWHVHRLTASDYQCVKVSIGNCTVTCSQFSYRMCTIDVHCRWHCLQTRLATLWQLTGS